MDDFIDYFKERFYFLRNYRLHPKRESIWCKLGFHKMKRGFGYSRNKRMDVCLKCNYQKWYKDKTYSK